RDFHVTGVQTCALPILDGVAEASLNLSNHRLQVRWSDARLPLSELLAELRRIGYAAHPYQPDEAAERLAQENRRAMRQLGVTGRSEERRVGQERRSWWR